LHKAVFNAFAKIQFLVKEMNRINKGLKIFLRVWFYGQEMGLRYGYLSNNVKII